MNAIVTGCAINSIGFYVAKHLLMLGYNVTITTRGDLSNILWNLQMFGNVDGYILELTNTNSVKEFTTWYISKYERLDILINNAGIHLDILSQWKNPQLTMDGYEIHWRTNYLGTLHLTLLLLPILQKTGNMYGEARIINTVSNLHRRGYNDGLFNSYPYDSWIAYGMSKLALIHMSNEIERRYGLENVHSYSVDPGVASTNISQKGLANNRLIKVLHSVLLPIERLFLLKPEDAAKTIIFCATQPKLSGGRDLHHPLGDANAR